MRIPPFFGARRTFVRLRPQTAVSTHVIHRSPPHTHTALRTPATQGTHMSPMIYQLILRLTAPEEFEDKPADDEIE